MPEIKFIVSGNSQVHGKRDNTHHDITLFHIHAHDMLPNNVLIGLSSYLTDACETGVAGVCSTGVSGAGTGTDTGTGAEDGIHLDRRVKGEAGRHSVRFMAGR